MRVLEACTNAAALLKSKKVQPENVMLEAQLLLGRALGVDRVYLIGHPEACLAEAVEMRFMAYVERRSKGEPIAYILGKKAFWTLELQVGPGVFIPRPDTECLIEAILSRLEPRKRKALAVLDLCTGSGAMLLSLLSELQGAFGVGLDVSSGALAFALANARTMGLLSRALFVRADIGGPLPFLPRRFDVVVSNPPYIPAEELSSLPRDVLGFEPRLALDGGDGGLRLYPGLIGQAASLLTSGGLLALECASAQAGCLVEWASASGGEDVCTVKDYGGMPRGILARFGKEMNS